MSANRGTMAAAATATSEPGVKKGKAGSGLFRPVYMDHRVTLTPIELRDASKDIDMYLTKKIRRRVEDKCCIHGWVQRGSTQILGRSMGQAEHCRFTGDFLYTCKIRVLCMLPESGQVVDAQVLKINKGGAYALIVDGGRVTEAARIFVPRDLHLGNQAYDELQEEQVIRVRILLSRFQANDPFIQAVGTFEGPSTAEVIVPARKGALEPAVPATEGTASSDVETTEEHMDVTQTETGFTISRKPIEAAPASSESVTESSSDATRTSESSEEFAAVAVPTGPPTKIQTNFAAIMAMAQASAAATPAPAKNDESESESNRTSSEASMGAGGLFGNAE